MGTLGKHTPENHLQAYCNVNCYRRKTLKRAAKSNEIRYCCDLAGVIQLRGVVDDEESNTTAIPRNIASPWNGPRTSIWATLSSNTEAFLLGVQGLQTPSRGSLRLGVEFTRFFYHFIYTY